MVSTDGKGSWLTSSALRKYFTPIMKGENKMSNKNGSFNDFISMFQDGKFPMPPIPPMPFAPPFGNACGWNGNRKAAEDNTQKDNVKSAIDSFLAQNIDMQKASLENGRKQWKQFFAYLMDRHDTFASSMPDDTASIPFLMNCPMSPKAFMKRVKEFYEMANAHFIEMADSFADFFIQGQEQVNDMVSSAMDSTVVAESEGVEIEIVEGEDVETEAAETEAAEGKDVETEVAEEEAAEEPVQAEDVSGDQNG
jgi:hypothetical protein